MTATEARRNLPASIAARILQLARKTGDDNQRLLTNFFFERFLYRLGESPLHDRFILKGAMLLRLWSESPYRATRDLDLLKKGDGSIDAVRADIEAICSVEVEPDGVEFDTESMELEVIQAEEEYTGVRVTLPADCGQVHIRLQIDIGVGDAVWPPPQALTYPGMLDFPEPRVLAYSRETVVAEKLEAMVMLGDRNSRIKDFFDLHYLAREFEFDRGILSDASRGTFERRGTLVPEEVPFGLTPEYWEDPTRAPQLRAFERRTGIVAGTGPDQQMLDDLRTFLLPVLDDVRRGESSTGTWPPGGPWR